MPLHGWAKTPVRFLVLAAAGLTVAGLAACDSSSGPTAQSSDAHVRQVTVVGAGKVQGTPDTVTVNASIEFIAPDATPAMNKTNDRMPATIPPTPPQPPAPQHP